VPIYHMQERRNGQWASLSWGDFDNYQMAAAAAEPLLAELEIDPADFRIKPAEEYPEDSVEVCDCGGIVVFDHETSGFRCSMCGAAFVIEEEPARVVKPIRYAIFFFLSKYFANLAQLCLDE